MPFLNPAVKGRLFVADGLGTAYGLARGGICVDKSYRVVAALVWVPCCLSSMYF